MTARARKAAAPSTAPEIPPGVPENEVSALESQTKDKPAEAPAAKITFTWDDLPEALPQEYVRATIGAPKTDIEADTPKVIKDRIRASHADYVKAVLGIDTAIRCEITLETYRDEQDGEEYEILLHDGEEPADGHVCKSGYRELTAEDLGKLHDASAVKKSKGGHAATIIQPCGTEARAKEFARLAKRYGKFADMTVRGDVDPKDKTRVVFYARPAEVRARVAAPSAEVKDAA